MAADALVDSTGQVYKPFIPAIIEKGVFAGDLTENLGIEIIEGIKTSKTMTFAKRKDAIARIWGSTFSSEELLEMEDLFLEVADIQFDTQINAKVFKNMVVQEWLAAGNDANDVDKMSPDFIASIMDKMLADSVKADLYRLSIVGDTRAKTLSNTTYGTYTVTPQVKHNLVDGWWRLVMARATTGTPTSSQIKRVAISNGAVAQVDTLTFTGTGGTATVTSGGLAKVATFNTDLATTAADFVTANAAVYAAVDVTLTYPGSGAAVVFTSAILGQPILTTVVNLATNLAGTVAATTANTPPTDLAADECLSILDSMYNAQSVELAETPEEQKVIVVDADMYHNLRITSRTLNLTEAGRAAGLGFINDGSFNGLGYFNIPVLRVNIKKYLNAYFPHAENKNPAYNNRAWLTERKNMLWLTDKQSAFGQIQTEYQIQPKKRLFAIEGALGLNIKDNNKIVVAY